MKYNDKHTIRWQQKQEDRTDGKSERATRRELKRSIDKFSIRVVRYVDRDWWDSLEHKDRAEVYHLWNNYIRSKYYQVMIPSIEVIDRDFEVWIKKIKSEVKPNTSIYRDKKIDRILNDN